MSSADWPERLSPKQAAAYCGLSLKTFARRRKAGADGPPFIKFDQKIWYPLAELKAWYDGHLRRP